MLPVGSLPSLLLVIRFPTQDFHLHQWTVDRDLGPVEISLFWSHASYAARPWLRWRPAFSTTDRAHTGATECLTEANLIARLELDECNHFRVIPANNMLPADCLRVRCFQQKSNWFVKKKKKNSKTAPTQFFKISSCSIPWSQNIFNCLQKMIQLYTVEKHTCWKNTFHERYKSFKEMPLKVRILDSKTRHQSNQYTVKCSIYKEPSWYAIHWARTSLFQCNQCKHCSQMWLLALLVLRITGEFMSLWLIESLTCW